MKETIDSIIERFEPCGAALLCEPLKIGERSAGGIIIPEVARNPLSQGKVLAVGDQLDVTSWPLGSIVMWTQHSEHKLIIDGVELAIITLDNVVLKSRISGTA